MDLREAERRIWQDPVVQRVIQEASRRGLRVYLVGGAVRDHILGRPHRDYDFVLEKVCPSFLNALGAFFEARYFPLGKGERVYRIVKGDKVLDFSPMAGADIVEDLRRRDFTINAIAYCPQERKFYSHPRSLEDLQRGLITPLSPKALDDDPLRILRGFRYMATLGFEMAEGLRELVREKASSLLRVAPERILMEMDEILLARGTRRALEAMAETGVLEVLFPELRPLRGVPQGHGPHDAFHHTLRVCCLALEKAKGQGPWGLSGDQEDVLVLGYAALFHDLGKGETMSLDGEGKVHFYGHESVSVEKARGIMERYPFSNARRERVLRLVANHMRPLGLLQAGATERALRRLSSAVAEDLPLLLTLALAETEEKGEDPAPLFALAQRLFEVRGREKAAEESPLIRGRDLLEMGLEPGPLIGEILRRVRDLQVEGKLRTREEALEFVRRTYQIKEGRE